MAKSIEKRLSHAAKGLFFLAAAVVLVWFMFQPAWFKNVKAEVTEQPFARTITVSGEGEVNAKPDIAIVNLSVVAQGRTVKEVTEDGNLRMNKVIEAVKSAGVKEEDMKTVGYNLRPEYTYPENRKPVIAGYVLDQNLRVKVKDLTTVESVVDGGVKSGANQVGQLSFEIDDDSEQRTVAREEAFKDAREKADAMAAAAGVKVSRVITFSEGYAPEPYYGMVRAEADFAVSEAVSAPSFEPGSQEVKVTVNVTYEIE